MELRGSRLIWKLRESHLYQKWRWWLHYHPLIFFSATTSLGIANLKLFFMYVLKTFFTHFGSFFTILRNSIFLLEWTTRMPFLPSILSIFNDAHSIAPSRHVYTLSLLRSAHPTISFCDLWCFSLKPYWSKKLCNECLTRCSIKSQGFARYFDGSKMTRILQLCKNVEPKKTHKNFWISFWFLIFLEKVQTYAYVGT